MKQLLLSFLFLSVHQLIFSQPDTIYYDANWNRLNSLDNAEIIGYKYYDNNQKGLAKYYWKSGELNSEQNEVNSSREGECKWYFKNGQLKVIGNYKDDQPIGEFTYFDSLGNYLFTNIYDELHSLNARYMKNANGVKIYDKCDELPVFGEYKKLKKAQRKLNHFIKKNKPAYLEKGNQKKLTITLLISDKGSVEGMKTEGVVSKEILKEIQEFVHKMPNWKPGKQNGKAVYSTYVITVKA